MLPPLHYQGDCLKAAALDWATQEPAWTEQQEGVCARMQRLHLGPRKYNNGIQRKMSSERKQVRRQLVHMSGTGLEPSMKVHVLKAHWPESQ